MTPMIYWGYFMSKKEIFIGILIAMALVVFIKKDYFFETLPGKFLGSESYKSETLQIVLNTSATDLSPYSLDLNNLIRTANVYEGLVAFDRNLKITPALAVSWGSLNDTTWEFKLRKGVIFHDGTPFNADSVLRSFDEAQKNGNSQIKSVLETVQELKKIDDYTIQLITNAPDPLVLSKLTKFFIHIKEAIGTGPYVRKNWAKGSQLSLAVFEGYWGKQPAYRTVNYTVTKNKTQRKSDFEQGNTDVLVAIPRDLALELPESQVKTSYSLEVNFLMFKLDDPLLKDRAMREAIKSLINPSAIEEIGNFFVRPVSQFVAPGVFGFSPAIPLFEFNEESMARNLFGQQKKTITLDSLDTYRTLTEYLKKQLQSAGFLVKDNVVAPNELLSRIKNNESQLFVIGWQAENGDAGDFLDNFIHSQGEFNGGRYNNTEVDRLIEQSRQELVPQKRLKMLQGIMKLVSDDLIGIPLFESSRLYAIKEGVKWEPRLDGLVLAIDVK